MFWFGMLLSLTAVGSHNLTCGGSDATRDGLLPPVRLIFNSSDSQMRDLVCLLDQMTNVVSHFAMEHDPCVQLLTLSAKPWELHVLLLRADVGSPLCEPRVYGPLPSVLQARFAQLDEGSLGSENIVSLQLNSRGGHLLFDLDLDNEEKVLSLALRNLLEIVEMPPKNTSRRREEAPFQIYQRTAELEANPAMTKQVDEARRRQKLAHSMSMSYVSAALTAPLLVYAFAVAYILLWDRETTLDVEPIRETTNSSVETDSLLKSSTTTTE